MSDATTTSGPGEGPAPERFCHLHVHSEYSSLDGACKIKDLVALAAERGHTHVGLSDHGTMSGLPGFYKAAKSAGITPVLGCEVYLTPDRHEKAKGTTTWHLGLIARTTEGYENLCRITSRAYLEGWGGNTGIFARPRADWEVLGDHSQGIIALTGCMAAPVMSAIFQGDLTGARVNTERLIEIFGRDNVYGEIQNVGIVEQIPADSELAHKLGKFTLSQTEANRELAIICESLGIPLVATGDVHYLRAEDAVPHDALLCVGTGQLQARDARGEVDLEPAQAQSDGRYRRKFSLLPKKYYFRSEAEMREALPEWPQALENAQLLAERCEASIPEGREMLPKFPVPEGFADEPSYLRHLCEEGMVWRYGAREGQTPEQRERLGFELGVIERMGYAGYFLIVGDFFQFARDKGIATGPGRGSAAGSIVAYVLGITQLCPLEYGLLFERFLNPDRVSMPDVDCDFSIVRRGEVIEYVREKYNTLAGCETAVSQIITHGMIGAKAGLRDAGRVLDKPLSLVNKLAKLVPDKPVGMSLRDVFKNVPAFRSAFETDPNARELITLAGWLEGFVRNEGVHAAGVVIWDRPLETAMPIQRKGPNAPLTTSYEMKHVEAAGALKMDFLGLRNLDIIWRALEIIKYTEDVELDPYAIPLDDAGTYQMLARGEAIGVFQFESGGMRSALQQVGPTEFNDLIALVALYRPGPMEYIPSYAARKQGREETVYLDPRLEPLTGETYGITVYQEQSMQIAKDLAGFTPGEADTLRKAIGKKDMTLMQSLKPKFVAGCVANGVPKAVAEQLWADNEKAADYSFNKCARGRTTYVRLPNGERMTLQRAYRVQPPEIMAMWPDGEIRPHRVHKIVKTGRKPVWKVRTAGKRMIEATAEHRLLTTEGYKRVDELRPGMGLIVRPRPVSEAQREARRRTMAEVRSRPEAREQDARTAERMRAYQATRTPEEKADHMRRMHEEHPHIARAWHAAGQERLRELWESDPEWREAQMARSLAQVRATYDTGPGWGTCSIASNGMWCASNNERAMCEWLIEQGVEFEMHRPLPSGRMCDFYFDGIYWEMDGLDRTREFFEEKYGADLPFVVVTPEDFREVVATHLGLEHAVNGDPIVSIEFSGEHQTYDVEMEADGPLNYLANNIVSHNSHAACYGYIAYATAYLKHNHPAAYMAALISLNASTKDKVPFFITEARRMGLRVLPPDVNRSLRDFAVMEVEERAEGQPRFEILFGLSAIKGVGEGVIADLRAERERSGPFRSVFDLIRRCPQFSKAVVELLVRSGALDCTGASRRAMLEAVAPAKEAEAKRAKEAEKAFMVKVLDDALVRLTEPPAAVDAPAESGSATLFDMALAESAPAPAKKGAAPKKPKLSTDQKRGLEAVARLAHASGQTPSEADARAAARKSLDSEALRKIRAALRKEADLVLDAETLDTQATERMAIEAEERARLAIELAATGIAAVEAVRAAAAEDFDLEAALAESFEDPQLSSEDWPELERLNEERKVLGLYASGHPLDGSKREWRRYVSHTLGSLGGAHIGQVVTVVGVITSARELKKKTGESFGWEYTLDDLTGSRPVTFFNDAIDDMAEGLLVAGGLCVIKAKVQEDSFQARKNEESGEEEGVDPDAKPVKLNGLSVHPWRPEQVSLEPIRPLEINLPPERRTPQVVALLKEVLGAHPGRSPVVLILDGARHQLVERVELNPTLMREVASLAGVPETAGAAAA